MAPKKRRGRKSLDESPVARPVETPNASGECGDNDSDVVSSSLGQEEQPARVSPIVVGDRKLSSAVLVLENCLLPASQRIAVSSPGSFPVEGLMQRKDSSPKLQKVSDVNDGDDFTGLLSSKVLDSEEVELASNSPQISKPKRVKTVKKSKQKLKSGLQTVPGQAELEIQSQELQRDVCDGDELGVVTSTPSLRDTGLELVTESLPVDDKKALEAENLSIKRRRKMAVKKEKPANRKRRRNRGDGVADVMDPKAEDEENGSTWMVSPSSGDEERVILKRRRKITVAQDPVLADVTTTGLLNADVQVASESSDCGSSAIHSSALEQSLMQNKVVAEHVAAVEAEICSSESTVLCKEVVAKGKRARRLRKTAAKSISPDNSEAKLIGISGLPVRKRTRLKGKALALGANSEGQNQVLTAASASTRVTRSRRSGCGGTMQKDTSYDNHKVNSNEETNTSTRISLSEVADTVPEISSEAVGIQEERVDDKEAISSLKQNQNIESMERELPGELQPSSVEANQESIQFLVNQVTPETTIDSRMVTSALNSEVGGDDVSVGGNMAGVSDSSVVPSNQKIYEQENLILECLSGGRTDDILEIGNNAVQKANPNLNEVISDPISTVPTYSGDQREDSRSSESLQVGENDVAAVLISGDKPACSDDVGFVMPPSEKQPSEQSSGDLSKYTENETKETPDSNEDMNIGQNENKNYLVSISLPAISVTENNSLTALDKCDDILQPNVTNFPSDACLDIASKSGQTFLSAIVDHVGYTIASGDPSIDVECDAVDKRTTNVKVDRQSESGEPSEVKTQDASDKNFQQSLSTSGVSDASLTRSEKPESTEDVGCNSVSDGLESGVEATAAKDAQCGSDGKKSKSDGGGGGAEETGFVPLKKRRLRIAEAAFDSNSKNNVTVNAVNLDAELGAKDVSCFGDLAVAKESNAASVNSASALPNAESVARCSMYVGSHVSTAGGLPGAVLSASQMGAHAFALFIKPQKTWTPPPLDEREASAFKELLKEKGYSPSMVLPHGSYLLNCGASNAEHLRRSRDALVDDLQRCRLLGLTLFNFHPGSFSDPDSVDECIARVAESINYAHSLVPDVITVIENSCGEFNSVGGSFSQLKQIIEKVTDMSRIGVCLDTCHAFAAGYDLRTKSGYKKMMEDFDTTIGRKFLKAVHVNDSRDDLGSHLDHHASIGKGKIGLACFQFLMADRSLENIPLILETPQSGHRHEIELLYSFASSLD